MATTSTVRPTDITVETPAQRQARAAYIHQRLQTEHAILTRARQELRRRDIPASIAVSRAMYVLARGQRTLARLAAEHASPTSAAVAA